MDNGEVGPEALINQLEVFLLSLDEMLVYLRGQPEIRLGFPKDSLVSH